MSSETKAAMKEVIKPAFVPKLRFPEFRGAAAWKSKRLGDLFSNRQETGLTGLPLLSLMDKEGIVPQEESNRKNNSNSDKSKYLRVVPGDIAYNTMRMWEGRSALVGMEGLVSPAYTVCEPKPGVHSLLFSYYLKSPQLIGQFRRFSQGIVKDTLNLKYPAFAQISALIPSYAEQQKIADCLSSLDELIAAQAQKVEALKTHKKGLMQQLFPLEGETRPLLRFPEFQGAGEWEMRRVDERGRVLAGKALAVNAPGPLRPYLRTKNVLDGSIELSDVLTMPMTDAEFSRFEILDGDVLLNEGQSLELVGRASIYRGEFRERCAMQNQLLRFRAFPVTCAEFAAQYFRKCQKDGTFANVATKTTSVAHLGSSRFSVLELAWPSLSEQHRIAFCLSRLDALITAETQKLKAFKAHKKGLMQQLFPSLEEARP
jgi:type I restriction enzyme S subunit